MRTKVVIMILILAVLSLPWMGMSQHVQYEKPDDAVLALFSDYKKLNFRNALEYTTDGLQEHIQKIVDYMNMNGNKVPENFYNQSERMENVEIFRSEIYEERYAVVGARWYFSIKDNSSNKVIKKIKKFGFMLVNEGQGWKIFKMSFLTEQILYN